MKRAAILLLLTACTTPSLKYGVGLNNGAFPDPTTKIMSVAAQGPLWGPLDFQSELGLFVDNSTGLGPTYFVSPFAIGVETKGPGLYVSYFVGPSLVSQTDHRLASLFEFNNNFALGIRDTRGLSIGLNYQHFSNAGLTDHNMGRDFLGLNITIPLHIK